MPIKKSYLEQKRYYRIAKVFFLLLPLLIILILYILQKFIIVPIFYIILQENIIVYAAIGLPLYYLVLNVVWRIFLYIAFGGLEDDTKKKGVVAAQPVGPAVQPVPAPVQTSTKPSKSQSAGFFILLILSAFFVWVLITGGFGGDGEICPEKPGQVTCGYCAEDVVTSNNPNAGKCFYCPEGSFCVGDPCSGITCSKSGGTSGSKSGESKSGKCIPTGCGSWWYCSGEIKVGMPGAEYGVKDVHECFPQPIDDMLSEMGYPAGAFWSGTCRQCP